MNVAGCVREDAAGRCACEHQQGGDRPPPLPHPRPRDGQAVGRGPGRVRGGEEVHFPRHVPGRVQAGPDAREAGYLRERHTLITYCILYRSGTEANN